MKRKRTSFGQRLAHELEQLAISQATVAARLRISPATVSGWFRLGAIPQPRVLDDLAAMLGVTTKWLRDGAEPKLAFESQQLGERVLRTLPRSGIREAAPPSHQAPVRMIPLLLWTQAGVAAVPDKIPAQRQAQIPAEVQDRQAFAIEVRGDAMEPKYSDGDVAVVLPRTAPHNGDLIVANLKQEGFAFRIMTYLGGDTRRIRLTSYNHQIYPAADYSREDFHWIFPVDSVTRKIRR